MRFTLIEKYSENIKLPLSKNKNARKEIQEVIDSDISDEEKLNSIKNILSRRTKGKADSISQFWANIILTDGLDGDFERLIEHIGIKGIEMGQDGVLYDMWNAYRSTQLLLHKRDGFIDPVILYSDSDIYKNSEQDATYIINAMSIVNNSESIRRFGVNDMNAEKVKSIFYNENDKLLKKSDIYQNIENIDTQEEEEDNNIENDKNLLIYNIIDGLQKTVSRDEKQSVDLIINTLITPVLDPDTDKIETYREKLQKVFDDRAKKNKFLNARIYPSTDKKENANILMKYLDEYADK